MKPGTQHGTSGLEISKSNFVQEEGRQKAENDRTIYLTSIAGKMLESIIKEKNNLSNQINIAQCTVPQVVELVLHTTGDPDLECCPCGVCTLAL